LLAERDALAEDRQTLIGEVQRLRQALVQAQAEPVVQAPVVSEPELLEPVVLAGPREEELLNDIARLQRNASTQVEQAVSRERARLLSVVADSYDDVARAIESASPEASDGLRTVLHALDDRLTSVGVSRVGRVGERFDPAQFEAVALDETQPNERVVAIVSTGLKDDNGRLLRPAKVVVGSSRLQSDVPQW
jgi:molecular chaperone GrpE (heat shock protein)